MFWPSIFTPVPILVFLAVLVIATKAQIDVPRVKVYPDDYISMREDEPIGARLGWIQVSNGDDLGLTSLSDQITLALDVGNSTSGLLRKNILLNKRLDRDAGVKSLPINIKVKNSEFVITHTINLLLVEVNDEVPILINLPYSVTVAEDHSLAPLDYSLIKATDRDTPDNQFYVIKAISQDADGDDPFRINSTTGKLYLQESLDYEKRLFYHYNLTVYDNANHTDSADLFITIKDVQDTPPSFSRSLYQADILENSPKGKVVLRVQAWDGDRGISNSISFSLTHKNNCPDLFELDLTTGEVILKSSPDRDIGIVYQQGGNCHLGIKAKEGDEHPQVSGSSITETDVTINVLDENDNKPLFSSSTYEADVDENTPQSLTLSLHSKVTVTDQDQGNNAIFSVQVTSLQDYFVAEPARVQSTGNISIKIKNSSILDYEKHQSPLKIELKAEDSKSGHFSSTDIFLTINNRNDNPPQFVKSSYHSEIQENSPANTSIIKVEALDKDINSGKDNFGTVTYSIQETDTSFKIDASSGIVTAERTFNREKKSLYYLTVVAKDGGNLQARTSLTVSITDANDESPIFVTDRYQSALEEESINLIQPVVVHATDKDETGTSNSEITYKLLSSIPEHLAMNFRMDSKSGNLTVRSALDYEGIPFDQYESGLIQLFVAAIDGGTPSLSTSATILISLLDINDHAPECEKAKHSKEVPENITSGSLIIRVKAQDKDATQPNNIYFYSLNEDSLRTFSINSQNGQIISAAALDREIQSDYSLTVFIKDRGMPSRSSNCSVRIIVQEINDEAPKFLKSRYEVTKKENERLSWNCNASDADLNPDLVYSIDWTKSSGQDGAGSVISLNDLKSWVEMNKSSCLVTSREQLDREKVEKMTLVLQVEDVCGEMNKPQISTATLYIIVEDLNDEIPVFENGPNFTASVRENTPANSQIYLQNGRILDVVDKDTLGTNSSFIVSLLNDNDIFEISPESGQSRQAIRISVKNSDVLDYEIVQQYVLKLVATESIPNPKLSSTSTVTINIENENDNVPEFINGPFHASVLENSPVGTSVISINAIDKDLAHYGNFTFALEGTHDSKLFYIDKYSGLVTVAGDGLNREAKDSYTMSVSVTDVGGFSSRTQLSVSIADVNDKPPVFSEKTYDVSIKENMDKFVPAFKVLAEDGDKAGSDNAKLTYSLSFIPSSLQSNLSINPKSGEIILTSPLDFESLIDGPGIDEGKIFLNVTVVDGGTPIYSDGAQVVITVLDENDNYPIFTQTDYSATVAENVISGHSIIEVAASDSDKIHNDVTYSVDSLSGETFSIDVKSGWIRVKSHLDRESKGTYSIHVTASDNGTPFNTGTALVTVQVTDINDEVPTFEQSRYEVTKKENERLSWNCNASDADLNPDLVYSIDWTKSSGQDGAGSVISLNDLKSWVEMNKSSCLVTSREQLDREKVEKMTLVLQVEDVCGEMNKPQISTATLYIIVEDLNDEIPVFENGPNFTASVRENTPANSQIYLQNGRILDVVDKDTLGTNSSFIVSLLNDNDIFEISPESGQSRQAIRISVKNSDVLDYEIVQQYVLKLVATESIPNPKLSSTSTVTINIENENDNVPEFINGPFHASVLENSPVGTSVISINAIDKDLAHYGNFTFALEGTHDSKLFYIDKYSGLVTVAGDGLNREAKDSYTMSVSVTDVGGFSSRTQLSVSIADVNDKPPVFSEKTYDVSIKENMDKFVPAFKVLAEDGDKAGSDNAKLTYSLSFIPSSLQSNLSINPKSGEIILTSPLDFESLIDGPGIDEGKIFLNVTVVDGGTPIYSDGTQVVITVLDENDNYPIFTQTDYSATVAENVISGHSIIEVAASDSDKIHNDVTYSVDSLSGETFSIDVKSGWIRVKSHLDRESKGTYSIHVTASDNGTPFNTGTALVTVQVTDINDEVPTFEQSRYEVTKKENERLSWNCNASDADLNPDLVYSIDWTKSSGQDGAGSVISLNDLKSWVEMNKSSCLVTSREQLDREKVEKMTLVLQVEDVCGEMNKPQISTATLYIIVEDLNDEIPVFENGPNFTASVRENTPANSQIYLQNGRILDVVDKDTLGTNSSFIVSLLNDNDIFEISPESGQSRQAIKISVKNSDVLDYEIVQQYVLKLVATESIPNPKLSSTSTVTINIENENDNVPEFINGPFHASVLENSPVGTSVISINAIDKDLGHYGNFTFALEGTHDSKLFYIDKYSGLVTVAGDGLNREAKDSYTMSVSVTDVGGFSSRTQLSVSIADVNDKPPVFSEKTYDVSIKENMDKFVPAFKVLAEDGDKAGSDNAKLTYSLSFIPSSLQSNLSINPKSGEIILTSPLDFESLIDGPGIDEGKIFLNVTVVDGGTPIYSDGAQVVITVLDENDNYPIFTQTDYSATVAENVISGHSIIEVAASDSDKIHNDVTYSVDSLSGETFSIDVKSGWIRVKSHLDRESKGTYSIHVTASDNGTPFNTGTALVTVQVTDINDEVPTFEQSRYEVTKKENERLSWNCNASDADLNPDLVYSIDWTKSSGQDGAGSVISLNDLKSWVEMNKSSCLVTSREQLDREKVEKMTLVLQVEDVCGEMNKPQISTATLYIIVEDLNDEIPVFENGPNFTASVRENTPANSQIYLQNGRILDVVDKDTLGTNSSFIVSLLNDNDIFEISPESGQSRQAIRISVKNSDVLDYEIVQQYVLKLVATESIPNPKLSSTSTVTINIENENDNVPEFINGPFHASVLENSPVGTSVISINAIDKDLGHYGNFTFALEGTHDSKLFYIDKYSGLVTVAGDGLNREAKDSYTMSVSVTDVGGFSSRTQLSVSIADVNDKPPVFSEKTYDVSIKENMDKFVPAFKVLAEDGDKAGSDNAKLTYSLSFIPSSLQSNLSINPKSGEIILTSPLDFESLIDGPGIDEGKIFLNVTVVDGGTPIYSDGTQVVITVLDENDNYPIFTQTDYSATVAENVISGHSIIEVAASDSDKIHNDVTYSVDSLSGETFSIDVKSGWIRVKSHLDRESKGTYSIHVTASDNGTPFNTGTALVTVQVTDINDEVPTFEQSRYEVTKKENERLSWNCNASDADLNPDLVYSIDWTKSSGQDGAGSVISLNDLKSWVEMNKSSCLVTSREQLDREKVEKMTLVLQVEDVCGEMNKPQISTATLYIIVEDLNDEIPVFENGPNFTASVRENTPANSQIYLQNGRILDVVDKDTLGTNSSFIVSLLNDNDIFEISPESGQSRQAIRISVKNSDVLDYEIVQQYVLKLVATESIPNPKLSSTSTVTINIENENDNVPEFINGPFHASVLENSPVGTSVISINAIDKDLAHYGNFTFALEGTHDSKLFYIDKYSGLVTVAGDGLNREAKDSYTMSVSVTDVGGFSSRTQLSVSIADVNDKPPVFSEKTYDVSIKENMDKFVPAFKVLAEDGDKAGSDNAKLTYSLSFIPSSLQSNLSINPKSGEIILTSPLDFESLIDGPGIDEGKIFLNVTVVDGGTPIYSDGAQVVITVLDENDNYPIFTQTDYSATVAENVISGHSIIEVAASDSDKIHNDVTYSVDSLSGETFSIDVKSGWIRVKSHLDRESKGTYSIHVTASDNGTPFNTGTALVTVQVTDINDEVPTFEQSRYEVTKKENERLSWNCNASDADLNPDLVYSIDWTKSSGQDGAGSVISLNDLKSWVEMNKSSCLVTSREQLDREKVEKMTLVLQVEDVCGEMNKPQISTATLYIIVEDLNDEIPVFENGPNFTASVRENTPANSQIYLQNGRILDVVDKDTLGTNSSFIVSLLNDNDIFEISPESGQSRQAIRISVKNSDVLDYEIVQQYVLKLVATESIPNPKLSSTSTVTINIENENDNVPEFINGPFHASVLENSPVGTSVISINAIDKDLAHYGNFTFALEGTHDSKLFYIDKYSGLVTVAGDGLNREAKDSYTMSVSVTDVGGFSSRTQLSVSIADVNDKPPVFSEKTYDVSIKENMDKFVPAFKVLAEDGDKAGSDNAKLTYSLSFIPSSLQSNLSINPKSGEIILTSPLDFESLIDGPGIDEGKIFLNVTVVDGGTPIYSDGAQVVITVLDENDNYPIFTQTDYSATVAENVISGHSIIEVAASDSDKIHNDVTYSVDSLSGETFSIDVKSGWIRVKSHLDRESKGTYSIHVTASDNGTPFNTGTALVTVQVTDINDEVPTFEQSRYEVTKKENERLSWNCNASDADLNPDLVYSIDWTKSSGQDGAGSVISLNDLKSWVEMNKSSCLVTSREQLDREKVEKMTLVLQVEDVCGEMNKPQISTATLYIIVEDLNDEIPVFENGPNFTASVRENTPANSQIYLQNGRILDVVDKDTLGTNSSFIVSLLNDNDIFEISPESGQSRQAIRISVKNSDVLDYEIVQQYVLKLVATESIPNPKLSSTSTVTINIENENDNVPEFINGPFHASVLENSPVGTSVISINAIDKDLAHYGNFTFALEGTHDSKLFYIDKYSGLVTVAGDGLNREAKDSYTMSVSVTDVGGFSSRTQLSVSIADVNDKPPVFSEKTYDVSIKENMDKFVPAFKVLAEDGDKAGSDNAKLTYSLSFIPSSLQSNLSINPKSGEIILTSPLDFESLIDGPGIDEGKIFLNVTVVDGGTPIYSDGAQVVITVLDENDNYPTFTHSDYSATVAENAARDEFVIHLTVDDNDRSAPNNETRCVLLSGSQDKFKINSPCQLTVDQTLDREKKDNYQLVVVAVDNGIPSYTGSATVNITISDINDSPPTLQYPFLNIHVWENESPFNMVLSINASDEDINSKLSFSLLIDEGIGRSDKNSLVPPESFKNWFSISTLGDTGILTVNSTLDREVAETLVLKVKVTDDNAQRNIPQAVTATVTVSLKDVNDNPPSFSIKEKTLSLSVSEAIQKGTEITTLTASDPDKDQSVTFTLLHGEKNTSYFEITKSGKLTLNKSLDRERLPLVNFTVLATDSGFPPMSSSLQVDVTLLDVNDNDPTFKNDSYSFDVLENSNSSTFIGRIVATDEDLGQNGNVTYTIQDETYFRIDKATGILFVNGKIDHETHPEIVFNAVARDNPILDAPRKTSVLVKVKVEDMNDNSPIFHNRVYAATILETAKNSTVVFVDPSIEVTDEDEGDNKDFSFSLRNISNLDCFDIDKKSGKVYVTCNDLVGLGGGQYEYLLEAKDHGDPSRSSSAIMTISIQDENINSPQFVQSGPLPIIPECALKQTSIYTFKATDNDANKENNGKVVYSLVDGGSSNHSSLLHIDPDSGLLTLVGKLDSESQGMITFQVKAEDEGIPEPKYTLSGEIDLEVQDINDNPPTFSQNSPVHFSILENHEGTDTVAFVNATDPDTNSSLQYTLTGEYADHFKIETKDGQAGEISIKKSLDRETVMSVTLTVAVEDASSSQWFEMCGVMQQSDRTKPEKNIVMNILDVNDNPPRFKRRLIQKGVLSNTKFGSLILNLNNQVQDNDTDVVNHHQFVLQGKPHPSSPETLRLTPQDGKQPIIVNRNGSVITNYAFSENAKGFFRLRVTVFEAPGNDTIDVQIYVVSDSQTVHVTHFKTEEQLRIMEKDVIEQMNNYIPSYTFVADNILPYSADEGTVDGSRSVMVVHAVDSSGNIVDGSELLSALDRSGKLVDILKRQFLVLKTEIGDSTALKTKSDTDIRIQFILFAVIGLLIIGFAITLYFLLMNIRRFKHKLKAATIEVHGLDTMDTDKFPGLDNQIKDANPIFMRDDIGFDDTEIDRPDLSDSGSQSSFNSLDKNEVGSMDSSRESGSDNQQDANLNFYPSYPERSTKRVSSTAASTGFINVTFNGDNDALNFTRSEDEIVRTEELVINAPDDTDIDETHEENANIELDVSELECTDI